LASTFGTAPGKRLTGVLATALLKNQHITVLTHIEVRQKIGQYCVQLLKLCYSANA